MVWCSAFAANGFLIRVRVVAYFRKMRGTSRGSPPRVSWSEVFWSWLGAFLGIAAVAWLEQLFLSDVGLILVIGSFGASAVLIYGAPKSPLAQPRNLLGGHVLSALVGVGAGLLLRGQPWLAAALAVSLAIAVMHLSRTLHPPGGATALIAVVGGPEVHSLGFLYALVPVALGAIIMLSVALLINNVAATRRYPEFWL